MHGALFLCQKAAPGGARPLALPFKYLFLKCVEDARMIVYYTNCIGILLGEYTMMWLSSILFLFFGTLSGTCMLDGDAESGIVLGSIAVLCASPYISMWKGYVEEKDKSKFTQTGEAFGKYWLTRRRIFRAVIMLALLSVAAAWVIVGLHDDVRNALYQNAVSEYEEELERRETAIEEYRDALQQYYIDARLAMGLDKEGWVTANVTVDRKAIDRWGNLGGTLGFDCYINGQSVRYGGRARVQVFGNNTLESELIEIDPSENDVGTKTSELYISPQQLNRGITFSHQVTVSENRGRYAGSYLTMMVTYTIQAETPLNTSVLSSIERPEQPEMDPLIKPRFESVPDDYAYIFSHNLLGQIILASLTATLLWYYMRRWKKDRGLLDERIKEAEREHQRLLREQEIEAARQEEQKRLCAEKEENERRARLEAEARQKQRLKEEEERKAYHKEVQEYLRQKLEKEREDRLDAIADAALEYAQTKEWLKEQLKTHTKEEIAGVPKSVKFLDGLPYDDGYQGKYGVFSVYTTEGGRCYHAVKGCCGASIDTNLIQAIEYGKTPCSKCARGFPTKLPEWYIKYRKIEKYNL